MSKSLQPLLPNEPKLAAENAERCEQKTAGSEKEQLADQLAWVYAKIGATHSSLGSLEQTSASQREENTKAAENARKLHFSRALDAYKQSVEVLKRRTDAAATKEYELIMLDAYHGLAHAYQNVAQTGYDPADSKEENDPIACYKNAEALFAHLLEIQKRQIDQDPSAAADEHVNLARLYRDMKQDDQAEKNFKIGVELWKKAADLPAGSADEDAGAHRIQVLGELAEFYSGLNRFADAAGAYDQIIDVQESYDLSRAREIGDSYSDLGQIYQALNQAEKASASFDLANLLQQATLNYRRGEREALCSDMLQLAPLYSKLGRYQQVWEAYIIAQTFGTCFTSKADEIEVELNRVLTSLTAIRTTDPLKTWEDEENLYQMLGLVGGPEKAEQDYDRRLASMGKRGREFIRQSGGKPTDQPRLRLYIDAVAGLGPLYVQRGNQAQALAAFRLVYSFLSAVTQSTDPVFVASYARYLKEYQRLLLESKNAREAAAVADAISALEAREKELTTPK